MNRKRVNVWGIKLKKKILLMTIGFYLLFIVLLYFYLFGIESGALPAELRGSPADPTTFLTEQEMNLSEEYSRIRDFLFFLEIPYEWILYLIFLLFGFGNKIENWGTKFTKTRILQNILYSFCLNLLVSIAFLPIRYLRYYLSKSYGISTQSITSWLRDWLIDFVINFGLVFLFVYLLQWLVKRSPIKWWLRAWFLMIPLAFFFMYIQPVVIDPLYNDFYPIQNKDLEAKILDLASQAGIPAEHVYEVNMSEKTNSLNAYVTGVGSNSRIVLWDTTLNTLNDEEILFIMAHEMAHYKEKHIYIGIAGYLLLSLAGLFLGAKIWEWARKKYSQVLQINDIGGLTSIVLLIFIMTILLSIANPFVNAVSRYQEMRADRYAIELTNDVDAATLTFQQLTKAGLSQVNPPLLVKWFRYGHPTMLERIVFVEEYRNE